jgi:hypothetical protein
MAALTEVAKKGPAAEKGSNVIRAAGEAHRQRLTGGSCPMRVVLEAWIIRYGPHRRIRTTDGSREAEKEIKKAASCVAHNWMAHEMEANARALMKTYGLTPEDIAGGWGKS